MAIIDVKHLLKTYGSIKAVNDVSFEVHEGEIFGMVGPNGAGKTTTIECIEGLRKPDAGEVHVLGLDPQREGRILRERIGIQLQESELQDHIRVKEAIRLFSSFYKSPIREESLLEKLGLTGIQNAYYGNLSGGQKKRLFIALALVGDPEIVFLDELTTGLDPQGRRVMWDLVRSIREEGKTVVMTTHYMEDAERLCDRVAIIDHGRIVALNRPEILIQRLGAEKKVVFTVANLFKPEPLQTLPGVTRIKQNGERIIVWGKGDDLLPNIVKIAEKQGWKLKNLRLMQPTLEDVYLSITGREVHD